MGHKQQVVCTHSCGAAGPTGTILVLKRRKTRYGSDIPAACTKFIDDLYGPGPQWST